MNLNFQDITILFDMLPIVINDHNLDLKISPQQKGSTDSILLQKNNNNVLSNLKDYNYSFSSWEGTYFSDQL